MRFIPTAIGTEFVWILLFEICLEFGPDSYRDWNLDFTL